jgi:hypothetical protein
MNAWWCIGMCRMKWFQFFNTHPSVTALESGRPNAGVAECILCRKAF